MKKLNFLILAISILCISCSEKQLIHKEVKIDNVIVRWYSTSSLSSTRGYVDVNFNDRWTNVLDCNDSSITDVNYEQGKVFIKVFEPDKFTYYSKKNEIETLKITIVPATYKQWLHYYQPEFENSVP